MTTLQGFTSTDTKKIIQRAAAIMRRTLTLTFDAVAEQVVFAATPAYVASGGGNAITADSTIDTLGVIPVEWSSQVETNLIPFIAKVYDRGAQQVVASVKDAVPTLENATLPQLSDDATLAYLQQVTNRIRFLSDEMWEMARDELITGVSLGESVQEMAARVKAVAKLSEKQALTVARTEVMAALNGGQYAQMRNLAEWAELTVTKKWEATDDHIVRPSHAKADGQSVSLDGYFSVGGKSLRYPGDPSGGGEAINCRCTVLYDVDSTSLETLTAAAVVVDNGQNLHDQVFKDNLAYVKVIIAAGKKFNAHEHPRGSDGRFIKKGFLPGNLLEVINVNLDIKELKNSELDEVAQSAKQLTPDHWSKLTPDQKQKVAAAVEESLEIGAPGSGDALLHLEDLGNDEMIVVDDDDDVDVFTPPEIMVNALDQSPELKKLNGDLMSGAISKDEYSKKLAEIQMKQANLTNEEAQKLWDKGLLTSTELDAVKKLNEKPGISTVSPFKINPNKGKSGDGYAAPGLWGKYGAAGLLIEAPDPNNASEPVYLMVQRGPGVSSNKGKWQLPGGAIDENETFEEGAARELVEEVGAFPEFLEAMTKVGSHDINVPIEGKKPWTYSNIAAKAPAIFKPKVDGTETGDAQWFTKSQIIAMKDSGLLHPALAKEINSVFSVFTKKKDDEETKLEVGEFSDLAGTPGTATVVDDDDDDIDGMGDMGDGADTVVVNAPTQLSPPKPVKITHALIHAKHQADTVIAQTGDGKTRVRWTAAGNYVIEEKGTTGWITIGVQPKSKTYGWLAQHFANEKWFEPGKLENNAPPAVKKSASQPTKWSDVNNFNYDKGDVVAEVGTPGEVGHTRIVTINLDDTGKFDFMIEMFTVDKTWNVFGYVSKSELAGGAIDDIVGAKKAWSFNIPGKKSYDTPSFGPVPPKQAKKVMPSKGLTELPGITTSLDLTGWKKIGNQQGSNQGGLFQAPNGVTYYVKKLKSAQHVKNEVLANQFYKAAGIDVPEVRAGINAPGLGDVVVSRLVLNAKSDLQSKLGDGPYLQKVQDGFAVDAWLANWDVVGLGYDNIVTADGKPWRIDNGGSLLYRAQGTPKGAALGDEVTELDTFKKSSINPSAAAVFSGMSKQQEAESAKKLLGITDDKIKQMVKDSGLSAPLADKLIARKNFILERYGLSGQNIGVSPNTKPVAQTPIPTPDVTPEPAADSDFTKHGPLTWSNLSYVAVQSNPGEIVAIGKGKNLTGNSVDYRVIAIDTNSKGWKIQYKLTDLNTWVPFNDLMSQDDFDNYGKTYKLKWKYGKTGEVVPQSTPLNTNVTVSNENVISNWNGVINNVHFNYGDGDVIAVTADDMLRVVKKIDATGDVFYDIEKHHSDGISWYPWINGLTSDVLKTEVEFEAKNWNTEWLLAPKPVKTTVSLNQVDLNFSTTMTPDQVVGIAPHVPAGKAIATGKDSTGKTWKVESTGDPDQLAIYEGMSGKSGVVANWQLFATPSPDIFTKDSGNVKWVPTGHALTAKENVEAGASSPTMSKAPSWVLSSTSIWDEYEKYPVGTVFAEGTSKSGSKYRLINGDVGGLTILTAEKQLDSGSWDVAAEILSVGTLGSWLKAPSMDDSWQIPGVTTAAPDVNVPNPGGNPIPNTPEAKSTNDISHVSVASKFAFYDHFKKLNISPSWSPKAIYEKLVKAQQTSPDADIQALNLPQLLAVVDYAIPFSQKKKSGKTPFTDKVVPWSQTTAGAKVLQGKHWNELKVFKKQLDTPANAGGTAAPTPASTLPKVNQVNSPVTAKSPTSPVPIPGAEPLAKSALETNSVPANKIGTAAVRKSVYAKFKENPDGKYLKHDPESIWKNLVQTQKAFPTLSMLDIIKIVDQGRADHTNATNAFEFEQKIKAWLGTKQGYMAATHEMPFDAEAILQHNAPSVAGIIGLSHQPTRTKAEVLAMDSSEFKVISTTDAATWRTKVKKFVTAVQKSAIYTYTGNAATSWMNPILRLKKKGTAAQMKTIQDAQDGMQPSEVDLLLHRGTGYDQFGAAKSHDDIVKLLGKTVQDKAFMSGSVGGSAAFGGSVLMEIEVPKGTGMMYVGGHNSGWSQHSGEREMLLSAGLRYRVLSVKKVGYQTVVRVRVVPPPDGSV